MDAVGNLFQQFAYVHDVVDMVLLMRENDAAVGKVFNCGTGTPTRIDDLAKTVIDRYGAIALKLELRPERPGDIQYSYTNRSLARKVLGYEPKIGRKAGLKETVA